MSPLEVRGQAGLHAILQQRVEVARERADLLAQPAHRLDEGSEICCSVRRCASASSPSRCSVRRCASASSSTLPASASTLPASSPSRCSVRRCAAASSLSASATGSPCRRADPRAGAANFEREVVEGSPGAREARSVSYHADRARHPALPTGGIASAPHVVGPARNPVARGRGTRRRASCAAHARAVARRRRRRGALRGARQAAIAGRRGVPQSTASARALRCGTSSTRGSGGVSRDARAARDATRVSTRSSRVRAGAPACRADWAENVRDGRDRPMGGHIPPDSVFLAVRRGSPQQGKRCLAQSVYIIRLDVRDSVGRRRSRRPA